MYLVLVLFMGLFAFKFVEKTREIKALTAQEIALQNQNNALETIQSRTKANIVRYRSTGYVEETARSELNYTKPGETSIQVPASQPAPVEHVRVAPAPRVVPPTQDPATQWWHSFFG